MDSGELGHGKGEAMEDHLFLWFGTRVKWFWRWLTRIFFRIPDSFRRLSWKPIWRNLNLGNFPDGKVHVGFFRTSGSPLELVNLFRAKHRKSACYAGYRFRCHAINLNISVTHLYSFGAKVAAELKSRQPHSHWCHTDVNKMDKMLTLFHFLSDDHTPNDIELIPLELVHWSCDAIRIAREAYLS